MNAVVFFFFWIAVVLRIKSVLESIALLEMIASCFGDDCCYCYCVGYCSSCAEDCCCIKECCAKILPTNLFPLCVFFPLSEQITHFVCPRYFTWV